MDSDDPTLKVARDLTEIVLLTGWLEDQAIHKACDRLMPGGEAMAAMGPMSPLSRWDAIEFVEMWNAEHYGEPDACDLSHVNDEPDDPDLLSTLLFWSEDWRARTGSRMPDKPTLGSEALWLHSALTWAYDNREFGWHDFARAANRVRVELENLLHRGSRESSTRVPCIDCEPNFEGHRPLLIRVYQDEAADDYHKCPRCKRKYDEKAFDRAKANQLACALAERFVKLQDARDVVTDKRRPDGHRPERTFNKWVSEGLVRSMRDEKTGQRYVWWPDVRSLDLETPKRSRAVRTHETRASRLDEPTNVG